MLTTVSIILSIDIGEFLVLIFFFLMACLAITAENITMDDKPYFESHFDGVQFSPQQFYDAIAELLSQKQIPGLKMCIVARKEGSWFSSSRLYLRVRRKELVIDICSFHFGTGQFISCRSGRIENFRRTLLGEESNLNKFLESVFFPETYYKSDQQAMFKKLVDSAIAETIASLKNNYGTGKY